MLRLAHLSSVKTRLAVRRGFATQKEQNDGKKASHKYSHTLNLPKTDLPMRAKQWKSEEIIQKATELYYWQQSQDQKKMYVTHDGPPYANGILHTGHALNKTLKDIVNRYKLLQGYKINYIPGWDCHGLPIEMKALQSEKKTEGLTPQDIREKARQLAESELKQQMATFRSWGIMGDWNNIYTTMAPEYEAAQLDVFLQMFKKGLIYRGLKPVYWSPSSRTALAEAELEYNESHVSKSMYLAFAVKKLGNYASGLSSYKNLHAVIWTTTPWTIPANVVRNQFEILNVEAISIHPELEYSVAEDEKSGRHFIVASSRVQALQKIVGAELTVKTVIPGKELVGTDCVHPLIPDQLSPILGGSHVTADSGTGLVHTAPAHGFDDFLVCRQHGIATLNCYVDDKGRFTNGLSQYGAISHLVGLSVLDKGNEGVIEALKSTDKLLKLESYTHKYPYDWRTKKPIIVRATKQWFANLKGIQKDAMEALSDVQYIPVLSRHRIESMVASRDDWCISRQRSWGLPIPVFYNSATDEPLLTEESIQHIRKVIQTHGSDAWWKMSTEELLAPEHNQPGVTYVKGTDTMDVWFDSGVSWAAVLKQRGVRLPADLYLEGSDQHRGWFQSSLLTAVGSGNAAPYKTILTHGFVMDEQGRKMSKSLGNIIEPSVIVSGGKNTKDWPGHGVDVLRMWTAHGDFSKDLHIGPSIINKVAESVRKIRNTLRFCIANCFDFEPTKKIPYNELSEVDQYMLHQLYLLRKEVTEAYDSYQFFRVYRALIDFCTVELSSFYFEITKDRLYEFLPEDKKRKSTQTVLHQVLTSINIFWAPIVCHIAEEVHQYTPLGKTVGSVFHLGWTKEQPEWNNPSLGNKWNQLRELRDEVNKRIENSRAEKKVKESLETDIHLFLPSDTNLYSLLKSLEDELTDMFVSSTTSLLPYDENNTKQYGLGKHTQLVWEPKFSSGDLPQVHVLVDLAKKSKCPRCWRHNSLKEEALCQRCDVVVQKLSTNK